MAKKITDDTAKAAMKDWQNADVELQTTQAQKRQQVTPLVQEFEAKEKELMDKKARAAEVLENYAVQNRETLLPGDAKSTNFFGATIGFKNSPAALKIKDGLELKDILANLEEEEMSEYIITKHELDKQGLLRNADSLTETLPKLGLEVVRNETFFVKA